jgi:hypothetical protein
MSESQLSALQSSSSSLVGRKALEDVVERQAKLPVDLTHEKWHPARGRCLTSNVTLGSSKSERLASKRI